MSPRATYPLVWRAIRDLHEMRIYLSMTYPDTAFELVEVTEDTWQGFYDQGVFFDDWS